jgi:hypothetical protein
MSSDTTWHAARWKAPDRRQCRRGDGPQATLSVPLDAQPSNSVIAQTHCGSGDAGVPTDPWSELSPEATQLLAIMGHRGGWHVNSLCEKSGLSVSEVACAMLKFGASRHRRHRIGDRVRLDTPVEPAITCSTPGGIESEIGMARSRTLTSRPVLNPRRHRIGDRTFEPMSELVMVRCSTPGGIESEIGRAGRLS